MCGMSDHVEALALKVWCDGIFKTIRAITKFNYSYQSFNQIWSLMSNEYFDPSGDQNVISRIQAKVALKMNIQS